MYRESHPEHHHHNFQRHDLHAGDPHRERTGGRGGFGHGDFGPEAFGRRGFGGGPRGFMPGGPHRRPKGAARDAILSLLSEKPYNGYLLIKEIAERTDGTWTPSPGSVYPTLQQLVDEGLIEPVGEGKRTDFQLTPEGTAHVTKNAEQLAQVWEDATDRREANADLRDSIAKLMGVVHQFRFAANEDQRTQAVTLLDETRRSLYRILGE